MDDDIFWKITLDDDSKRRKETDFLAPSRSCFDDREQVKKASGGQWCAESLASTSAIGSGDFALDIKEIRGQGVLDLVGGELWEEALLLCAYILIRPEMFVKQAVLELGAGVGLCSLLLLQLKLRTACAGIGALCMTDNEAQVLNNLCDVVASSLADVKTKPLPERDPSCSDGGGGGGLGSDVQVSVEHLDWFDEKCYPDPQRFDIAIGSALCYSLDLADALRRTILHLLQPGARCKEVVILQIHDRPGFQRLLHALARDERLLVDIQAITEDVYSLAQNISSSASQPLSHFFETSCFRDENEDALNANVTCTKRYFLPDLERLAIDRGNECILSSRGERPVPSGHRRNLLKTSAETFVLVSIKVREN